MIDIEMRQSEMMKKLARAGHLLGEARDQLCVILENVPLHTTKSRRVLRLLDRTTKFVDLLSSVREATDEIYEDFQELTRQTAGDLDSAPYQVKELRGSIRMVSDELDRVISLLSKLESDTQKLAPRQNVPRRPKPTATLIARQFRLSRQFVALVFAKLRDALGE